MSTRLAKVREIWTAMGTDTVAGLEVLFEHSHPDCVFIPATDRKTELRGVAEAREYLHGLVEAGTKLEMRSNEIEELPDENRVVVSGDARLHRADGSFADQTGIWTYDFDETDRIIRSVSS
ncbi:MAG: hypothetical protein H0V29_07600 [Thermoleophilaceae bacterium]|nr:hypothetical protein [Thermoleophilaceae bacterium]